MNKVKVTVELSSGKVEMREPLVRDALAVQNIKSQEEREVRYIGNLTNLAPDEIGALPMRDYAKLQKALMGFLQEQPFQTDATA